MIPAELVEAIAQVEGWRAYTCDRCEVRGVGTRCWFCGGDVRLGVGRQVKVH